MKTLSGLAAAMLTLALAVVGNVVATTAPAQAATGAMRPCRISDWDGGKSKTFRQITLKKSRFGMTHAVRRRIPAGVGFTRKVELTKIDVLSASLEASATVKADAGAFFAKASVEAGVKVGAAGSKTTSKSVTETFDVASAKRDRLFVFYAGYQTFGFRAHKRICNHGQHDSYGQLRSFDVIDESGAVLCPASRYKKGSVKYQIARKGGC
ncbi:hypothetical protein [Nocardioides lijunqiniae]|uniref:hypothetical protein n=1 Tax=Nocardioides lijunqiniae TaxID=2760832 RepID=UPI00187792CB|nr:hypothetical protein [Nocardioides lijunqiniae]